MNTEQKPDCLSVDTFDLASECASHPSLVARAEIALADASLAVSLAQLALDRVKASLSITIRRRPDKFGIEKITESAIDAVVEGTPEASDARAALLNARHAAEIAESYAKAVDRKGSMLGLLVNLSHPARFTT